MFRILFLSLGFIFLWNCASTPKESLYEILEKEQCPSGNFRGWGIADGEMAAVDLAKVNIASEMQDTISVQSKYINKVIDEKDNTYFESQINRNYSINNASDAKIKFKKQQGKEIGIVVCMAKADAAKSFLERQRLLADSLELASNTELNTEHPKQKNKAWQKTQMLYNDFMRIQYLLEGWGVKSPYMADEVYSKAREDYKNYCQTAKLHWNPEKNTLYSDIAFSKLSGNIKIEKSPCNDRGISLAYKGSEPHCSVEFGLNTCSYAQSLSIRTCDGTEYTQLKSEATGVHQKPKLALDKLQNNLKSAEFWNQWIKEIKQWSPQCE